MAGARLRAKQLVEAAVNTDLEKFTLENNVYVNSNLKNVAEDPCNSKHVREWIEHDQAPVPSTSHFSYIQNICNEIYETNSSPFDIDLPGDIIEDSQFEIETLPKRTSRRTKSYTILKNVYVSDTDSDFSSDSNEMYIPKSSTDHSFGNLPKDQPSTSGIRASLNHSDSLQRPDKDFTLPYTTENHELPAHENTDRLNQHNSNDIHASNIGFQENEVFQERNTSQKRKKIPPKDNKSKKRQRKESTWKKKAAAQAREEGKEYTSYKNTVIPRKTVKEGILCNEKCRLKCSDKFSTANREDILCGFYSLDVNSKNALLYSSITSKPVARPRTNVRRHKLASYTYVIKFEGITNQVCKLAMCALYQISRKKIDVIKEKIKKGGSAPSPDRRGKHQNRPHKMDEEVIRRIKQHISSFPAEQSHYSRNKNIHKLYLSPLLNVTKMHSLYLEACNDESLSAKFKIKKGAYNKIFVTQFNLSFGYPKSDTCSTCDSGNCTDEHKESYHAAVEAMKIDRKKPKPAGDIIYVTVDLQQTMPLPKLSTSKAFYLRQLWFYNLGIHVIDGKSHEKAVCCTWTEDIADRGSSEVASALLRFIEVDPSCQGKEHLIVWSDSCAGQNKNFNMIALYQYLILIKYFKIIDHKFPEVGHSYLDSDRDFGRIEKVLRKHDTIYAPEQYRSILCKASRNNTVIDMTNHFRKINELQKNLNLINRKKDCNNGKVSFRDGIKWLRVEEYGSYLYKECYDEMTPFKKVDIMKGRGHVDRNLKVLRVEGKYGSVTTEKKNNIREQLKFVKEEYRYFYETIINE